MKINSKSVTGFLLALLCFALLYQSQAFASGINAVVASLSEYQAENGGFRFTRDQEPSLEATSHALFLSSLFGLKSKLDLESTRTFLASLKNQDNGYSNQPGQPSDVESVRNAILSLQHLGVDIENGKEIAAFVDSLFDRDTKLYSNTFSDAGNIKSTALALQSLSLLGLLDTPSAKEKSAAIKETFSNLIKSDAVSKTKYFFSLTSDNYYAILVAHFVGLDLGETAQWAKYFVDRQAADGAYAGGFYADQEHSDISPEDTSNAIAALAVLEGAKESWTDLIDTEYLANYISVLPRSLRSAYYGFSSYAKTGILQRTTFRNIPLYDYNPPLPRPAPPPHVIIQGSVVRTALSARTFFGVVHPDLDVSVTVVRERTGEKFTESLKYNAENELYYSETLQYQASELGDVSFQFAMKWTVPDFGELSMFVEDRRVVGYDLNVAARARYLDEDIKVGGHVSKGTQFEFDVRLGNVQSPRPSLISGDFDVVFSVLDSSDAVIFRQVFDARKNTRAISFQYVLGSNDIPAGDLTFRFEVGDQKNGYFSVDTVSYNLPLTMVATNIEFTGFAAGAHPTYEIGQTINVQMQPGSLLDDVEFYSSKDHEHKDIRRKFVMHISSAETHEGLLIVDGIPKVGTDGKLSYVFSLPIQSSFGYLGTNEVSFVYVTANGNKVLLRNYDLQTGNFVEDGKQLTYTVKADLHITNLKSELQTGKLDYGNNVKLSFQVKDDISKKLVYAENAQNTVHLVLKHSDGKKTFTSTRQAATQVVDKQTGKPSLFQINWAVNPNAIKGQGFVEVVLLGTDLKETTLLDENSKNAWKVDVEVGGSISVSEKKYVDIVDDEDAVFLVEFDLTCNEKKLKDALLQAEVSYGGEKVITLPVTEGRTGGYTISWIQSLQYARAGTYTIQVYRDVDIKRGESEKVEPLFSVNLVHPGASTKFPVKLEVVALVGLGASFFWLVFQKMEVEGTRNKNKNKKKTK